MSAEVYVYN